MNFTMKSLLTFPKRKLILSSSPTARHGTSICLIYQTFHGKREGSAPSILTMGMRPPPIFGNICPNRMLLMASRKRQQKRLSKRLRGKNLTFGKSSERSKTKPLGATISSVANLNAIGKSLQPSTANTKKFSQIDPMWKVPKMKC